MGEESREPGDKGVYCERSQRRARLHEMVEVGVPTEAHGQRSGGRGLHGRIGR